MKAIIIYFSSTGRTKKTAESIGNQLSKYEVDYFPFILKGHFGMKVSILSQHTNGDFSTITKELEDLEKLDQDYDLIILGMPTYGDFPPSAFYEIIKRLNLKGKNVVIFDTCSFTGVKTLEVMKKTVEEAGANIINQARFKGLFRPKLRKASQFGQIINES